MNNVIPVEINPQEVLGTRGNVMFQTINDFVKQSFMVSDYVKIKGENIIYHKDEANEVVNRLIELAR
ncbi:MAG: hypothetical protein J6I41_03510 [Bacteroidales bacterium]|nr:hypothetical protein [Bacteroidales bacterium]